MLKALKVILDVQELDIKMIRLMRLKKERQKELKQLVLVGLDFEKKCHDKKEGIAEFKKTIKLEEGNVNDVIAKLKKLEAQQGAVKKVEEFNALTQEMAQAEREKHSKEQRLSDLYDQLAAEEDALKLLQQAAEASQENSKVLQAELKESIERINEEGRGLKKERDLLAQQADPDIFRIYEKLLRNKKERVVVPIENRCCSGCHIMLTAQDENLVRKGERLVFCEHCSRIHYWSESKTLEGTKAALKPRRRRTTKVS